MITLISSIILAGKEVNMDPEDDINYYYEDDADYEFEHDHQDWDDEDGWPDEEY